ncbi:hypothetical protein SK571_34390 [Lentzea sp. BCCO 10_0798]|uniref:Carboxypeptidase regulatory-like domain-containing protein n=1 Tax=Lentzea kristufekii TaxID=3095430 RepID=A0ABU4U1P1_9PSEU|nr:hypothetical protein [Lentzea sp. BCCO 10_0798]MDX8054486.1 hypothetical protein [Lentzea sp. BCCO 10_0798]
MNTNGAAGPLDDRDFLILDGVRDVYSAIDPMPEDMLDNIRFALAVEHLETEVARAASDLVAVVTRGENEQRLVSFESPSMTITLGIRANDDGTMRLDGWLTPPGTHHVELRTPAGTVTAESDERGRFAMDGVPRTSAYLTVRPARMRAITTPTIAL